MFAKLKSVVVKWFIPQPEEISRIATSAIVDFVNSSGKDQIIASFVNKTEEFRKIQQIVCTWLADGKIDDNEQAEFQKMILPIAQSLYDKIMANIK